MFWISHRTKQEDLRTTPLFTLIEKDYATIKTFGVSREDHRLRICAHKDLFLPRIFVSISVKHKRDSKISDM